MNPTAAGNSQDRLNEIAFFNAFARSADYDIFTAAGYRSLLRAFRGMLGPDLSRIRDALDLGCGTGSFTRRVKEQFGLRVTGVDIASEAVRRAGQKSDGIRYLVSDAGRLGVRGASMDLVIFSGVLHHFPRPDECLNEAFRILRPGGTVLSYDPHVNNPCMWLYRHPDSPLCSTTGRTPNEKLLGKPDMRLALEKTGFVNVRTRAVSGVTMHYVESRRARRLLPLYNCFESMLGWTPLAETFGSFLICGAEKK